MKRRWVIPLIVMVILLPLLIFRWEEVAFKTYTNSIAIFEKDRWTGQLYVSQYGGPDDTFYRIPEFAYDYSKKEWDIDKAKNIFHKQKALTAAWWVLLAISAAWLLIEFYRPRREESLPF